MLDHMLRHDFLPGYFDSSHNTKTDSLFLVNKYYFWINVMSHYEYDFMANLPSLADVAFDLDDLFTPVYFSTLNI